MIEPALQLTLGVIVLLLVFDVCQQTRDVVGLLRHMKRERRRPDLSEGLRLPSTAVVLSLRGPDPRLSETLTALIKQDYPDFQIHVVVDNERDPVLDDVMRIQEQDSTGRVRVSVLKNPARTCSLKCSSLIQAVQDLSSSTEVVAFIDGDVVPHRRWLHELVLPLANGEADVAGGNRWYLPPSASVGAMSRYFWNAAYLTGMWAQGAPWAGTMALHRDTIDRIGLLEAWGKAMSVDATLHRCMQQHKLRFRLVGSLIMPNREEIGVKEFHRWVTRQMAVIRYSAKATVRMAEIQVGILLVLHTLLPLIGLIAWRSELPSTALAAVGLLAGYWSICAVRMVFIERAMRRSLNARNEPTGWLGPGHLLMWYPAVIATHYVIGTGVLMALRLKQVDWRGIRYRLSSNGIVSMADYQPYGADWIRTDNHSIV
ncbi:MAG: glycosyltransferase family 2 protein [Fuerstiella sp.]